MIKVDTMSDGQQLELIRLQQAVLIGSVLFVTSFLSNLGYTVSLFFIGFAVCPLFSPLFFDFNKIVIHNNVLSTAKIVIWLITFAKKQL